MTVTNEGKLEGGRRSEVTTPTEGGWGWMIVAGCFLSTVCTRAVTRCVSIFFVEFQLHFEKDYSSTAWIHSLMDSITMLCAPLGGFLMNRFSCRATVILGGLLSSTGLVLSSFASSLEDLYVSLGVLTGLGFALSYTPALAMVGRYFRERKALAYGVALSGGGIGTFVLAPVVQLLIEHRSWRGALLILGGLVSNLCVCGALMRPLGPGSRDRMLEDMNLEKDGRTTALESKDAELNNLMDTEGILIANGALRNFRPETVELSSSRPPDPNITDVKITDCSLFSNHITETVIKPSDTKPANSRTTEDLKPEEHLNLNNKAAEIEESGLTEAKPTETRSSWFCLRSREETRSSWFCLRSREETWASWFCLRSREETRSSWFCLRSREKSGFLLMPDFLILSMSFLFLAYGCSAPVVYLVPYALSVALEHQQAAFLMSIFGVSGIVGNITFGWITDRKCVRRFRMLSYLLAISMNGLCCMFAHLLHSFSSLFTFSLLYGYFDGAYVALIPVVTSDVVGSTHLTSALGVVYFLHAVPYLISPPVGGWLVDRTGTYAATFFLSGASFMSSSVVLAAAMLVRRCQRSDSAAALRPDEQRGVM